MYYLQNLPQIPLVSDIASLMQLAVLYPASFYFSNLNIPDQISASFNLSNSLLGTPPVNYPNGLNGGGAINQFFVIKMKAQLKLPAGSGTQQFQFALGSDDGSIFYINPLPAILPSATATPPVYLNNDGIHGFSWSCSPVNVAANSSPFVTLSDSQPSPFEMDWMQAPPEELGLVLLVRPAPGNGLAPCTDPGIFPSGDLVVPAPVAPWQFVPNNWFVPSASAPNSNC